MVEGSAVIPDFKPYVYLVNPPANPEQLKGSLAPIVRNLFFNSPPLGLAYIAAVLEQAEIPVRILDAGAEGLTLTKSVDKVLAGGADIVGITTTTIFYSNALRFARELRTRKPDIKIAIGGPHVSGVPEGVMTEDCFDAACVGEGEYTMRDLVHAWREKQSLSSVPGIVYRYGDTVLKTEARPLLKNLDELPLPARHLLPLDSYIPQPNDGPFIPKHAMISSRGCPYQCIFCDHATYGVSYRSFSAARTVDEMEELVYRHQARDIAFVDSLFMVSKQRVLDIVNEIQKRELKVHWTCTIRANIATRDVLSRMKEAGCWRVRIGVEAGNEDVLRFIRKDVTKDQVRNVTRIADDLGLHPKAFFIVGHPTETEEKILESITFAKSLPITDVTVQINTPLPGAPEWHLAREYGQLTTTDWSHYSFWEPVFIPNGLTREKLDALYRKFYRDFYFRPITVWRHLKMLKNFNDLKRFVRAVPILASMLSSPPDEICGGRQ
jgi:anaerobic magnesium-protoporphyrin IX monomethyl ester cyclase